MQRLWVRTTLTAFFDDKGIIHHEFVPEKHTVNGKFYKEVIKIRPEFQKSESWHLLHENAPVHSSDVVSKLLAKGGIPMLSQPPYSPDLSLADFFIS
jgi:hypothetical protein